jgi:hypothetical protein
VISVQRDDSFPAEQPVDGAFGGVGCVTDLGCQRVGLGREWIARRLRGESFHDLHDQRSGRRNVEPRTGAVQQRYSFEEVRTIFVPVRRQRLWNTDRVHSRIHSRAKRGERLQVRVGGQPGVERHIEDARQTNSDQNVRRARRYFRLCM